MFFITKKMKYLFIVLLYHVNAHALRPSVKCPCSSPSLCEIMEKFPQTEVFIYSLKSYNVKNYDWSKITTVVEFGYHDSELMCLAHEMGARVLTNANLDVNSLTNATARSQWIDQQIEFVKSNYIDGVNVDFESPINKNQTDIKNGLTDLIKELTQRLKAESTRYMVAVDFAWTPPAVDGRWYDYKAIADIVDIAFVMAYDERSQIFGPCIAWANSPFNQSVSGINKFQDMGISANKLVLGVPWYGYVYTCVDNTKNVCYIEPVPFRGVACSDAAGSQVNYGTIEEHLLPYSLTGLLWDDVAQSPYFMFKDNSSGQLKQVWFDDPKSLSIKYNYAKKAGLRGVGMWNADAIDYNNTYQRNAMWGALPSKIKQRTNVHVGDNLT